MVPAVLLAARQAAGIYHHVLAARVGRRDLRLRGPRPRADRHPGDPIELELELPALGIGRDREGLVLVPARLDRDLAGLPDGDRQVVGPVEQLLVVLPDLERAEVL